MQTGEAVSYAAQADDNLSEQDVFEHGDLIEIADKAELTSFVNHSVFACTAIKSVDSKSIIDAVWVRKWKFNVTNQKWEV
eukprot:2974333-Pyramimonas_sp.AAC.1